MPEETNSNIAGEQPDLTVVICLTSGGREPIANCLEALRISARDHRIECIVPYDTRLDGVAELALRFPWVQFVDAREEIETAGLARLTHEHHHMLRAVGLRRAHGRIIAMLEDHGPPDTGWCNAILEAHKSSAAVVGGAVENAMDRPLNWAAYYCDFGQFENPVPSGPAEWVTDINISYKREALLSVQNLWQKSFHEPTVNGALASRGELLILNPRQIIYETRTNLRLLPALVERFVWGRSFAGVRAQQSGSLKRWMLAALSWMIPFVRGRRIVTRSLQRNRHVKQMLTALPAICLLETFWALGEFVGYVTARPSAKPRPGKTIELQSCEPSRS